MHRFAVRSFVVAAVAVGTVSGFLFRPGLLCGREERPPQNDRLVEVYETKDRDAVTLHARLTNCTEATITLDATLLNATASEDLPCTADAAGRRDFVLVVFRRANAYFPWQYRWRFDWKPGRRNDVQSHSYVYALPYLGRSYRVTQGPLGEFSHGEGSGNEQAIDWVMPEGTRVFAARGGKVVTIRQDSDVAGRDAAYKSSANLIVVQHEDGTFAEYLHLKKDSVLVKLGDEIQRGAPLALSGNTGWSMGPHLHFAVFTNLDGRTRRSFPIDFRLKDGTTTRLREGKSY